MTKENNKIKYNESFPKIDDHKLNAITNSMWNNYGRVFAEYMFMKNFRNDNTNNNIKIIGKEILEDLKKE